MADTISLVTSKDLARTYHSRAYTDSWELVEDYWRVMNYAAERPNLGSQALASRLDLPRSRIRPWVRKPDADRKPARPDPVRAIQAAESHDWIPLTYESNEFRALNQLVAWIFSGGSIRKGQFVPLFAIGGNSDRFRLVGLFDGLGIEYAIVREDETGRATEYRPTTHASVLGRVLSLLGAPVGTKNVDAPIQLPAYLDGSPDSVRRDFVDVYLQNRGHCHGEKDVITLREERSETYLRELAALIADVSGGKTTVSEKNVILSVDAARALKP